MYNISLIEKENIYSIIPLLKILNDTIDEATLKSRLDEMIKAGYECVGVYEADVLIGICGLWILTKYYVGKHMEPDNVIIHPHYRSKGIGNLMMEWIFKYAESKGCVASELNCYVFNEKGLKFWESQGYKVIGYHLQKKLS